MKKKGKSFKSGKNFLIFHEKEIFLHEFMINGIWNYLSPTEEDCKNLYSFLFDVYELKNSPKIKILESSLNSSKYSLKKEKEVFYDPYENLINKYFPNLSKKP